ncbi:hypothetical protein PMNALOAF_2468 [Methylobacterium adhaesivum]|uniref:Integrase n=1 Tax=Methylobacterium adhaesivum TaxID=333297 RepID=A0ABT8BHQ1_9HYPH|nr:MULTISPECIES: hypothetical protein [Methylobacterium]KQT84968.1 hypothetical protein ASG51_02600 [Methylobacterium sp. Leaf465]MDN3591649.1 hypothetical protein [Methylobacterium adhaesivum]GJD31214.1 hypothetical protein PMNALOAF_2468 [Methylobacterium adhaesivum]
MGARKGQNNFGLHQREVTEANLVKVRRALKALPRRTKYETFHALRNAVAMGSGLHATTLSRNKRYRAEILRFVAENPRLIPAPEDDVRPRAALAAKALDADINTNLLRRDNVRLRKLIERNGVNAELPAPTTDGDGEGRAYRIAFERTATVLGRLLTHLTEEEFGIVLDKGEIRNTAQVGSKSLIAGPPDTTPFVEWLRKQPRTRNQLNEDV